MKLTAFGRSMLVGGILLFSLPNQAAIVDLGAITRDTDTELDWLDVTETAGRTYLDVSSKFGVGQEFEGWRYATSEEFDQLIANFGYLPGEANCIWSVGYCDYGMNGDNPIIELIIRTLGDTGDAWLDLAGAAFDVAPSGAGGFSGMLADVHSYGGNTPLVYWSAGVQDGEYIDRSSGLPFEDNFDSVSSYGGQRQANYHSDQRIGSLLVRTATSSVPLPASAWLFGSAILGLGALRRK